MSVELPGVEIEEARLPPITPEVSMIEAPPTPGVGTVIVLCTFLYCFSITWYFATSSKTLNFYAIAS